MVEKFTKQMNEENISSQVPSSTDGSEVGVEEEEPVETPVENVDTKTSLGSYKKLDFNVVDIKKNVPDIPHVKEDEENKPVESTFTKEDAVFLAQMIWAIPPSVFGEYMEPNPKLVKSWGEQLFVYCEKKGINLGDYLFDELGIVMATGMLIGDVSMKYRKYKKELKDAAQTELETE